MFYFRVGVDPAVWLRFRRSALHLLTVGIPRTCYKVYVNYMLAEIKSSMPVLRQFSWPCQDVSSDCS